MKTNVPSLPITSTISDVERDTGVAKETLRVWERRYDFPRPVRDPNGERVYSEEQVQKLRLVKRLIDLGFRPGRVIQLSAAELQAMAEKAGSGKHPAAAVPHPDLQMYLGLCKTHEMEVLRRRLSQALLVMGLKSFVTDLVAPLTSLVGEAWAYGQLAVFEEHLYTESVNMVMRSAIFSVPQANNGMGAPRIMLTTLPQERHGLGLLMMEAMCVVEGAHCISLGVQTPLQDIVEAARAQRIDIVALSFSASSNPRQAMDGLADLQARLPEHCALWAGGASTSLKRRNPKFMRVLELAEISAAITEWRGRHAHLRAG
ncbi:MAG: MerR family transcriptional regulator [Burkholderiaceae bacterium]|nr:MerR family transcriptional regulator [Burkholderiaceae bacterium]